MPPATIMLRVMLYFILIGTMVALAWMMLKYLFGIETGFVWRLLGIQRERKEKKFEKLLEKEMKK